MTPRPPTLARSLRIVDLGRDVPYRAALDRQESCAAARRKADAEPCETLFLLEHAPVFTLGRNADPSHVLWDEAVRATRGVALERTARGGDVTFHGPGQLVGYPVFRIGRDPTRIVPYMTALEDALLRAVAVLGIRAGRDARNRGIWVGNAKLAALGVRVAGGVTLHGFALNVAPDLAAFEGIVPCGLRNAGVTSLARLLPEPPSMQTVKDVVVAAFAAEFGFSDVRQEDAAAGEGG